MQHHWSSAGMQEHDEGVAAARGLHRMLEHARFSASPAVLAGDAENLAVNAENKTAIRAISGIEAIVKRTPFNRTEIS